ncbi:unnamed protein product [Boreogadus saida]
MQAVVDGSPERWFRGRTKDELRSSERPGWSHGVDGPALCATPLVGTLDIQSTRVCFALLCIWVKAEGMRGLV